MIEDFIRDLLEKRKGYLYAIIGFVASFLLVTVGLFGGIFVLIVTFICYCLGNPKMMKKVKKAKKLLAEKLKEE